MNKSELKEIMERQLKIIGTASQIIFGLSILCFTYATFCIQALGKPPLSVFYIMSLFSTIAIFVLIFLLITRGKKFLEYENKLERRLNGKTSRKQK